MGDRGGGHYFLGCRIAKKGMIGGARKGEYYLSKPWWSSGRIYAPGGPSSGLKGSILFLEIVDFLFLGEQPSCDGGGRAAPRFVC